MKLKVPVGLIGSSVGGAAIQQWTCDGEHQALYHDGKYPVRKEHIKLGGGMSHLYNGMIAPLLPFSIRGAIWYQGESNGKPLTFFEVAGADNVYHKAQAEIVGTDSVTVWSEAVAEPKHVRFAWHDVAMPNLANGAGLPALCFRTDKNCPPPLKYDWPADMGGVD